MEMKVVSNIKYEFTNKTKGTDKEKNSSDRHTYTNERTNQHVTFNHTQSENTKTTRRIFKEGRANML